MIIKIPFKIETGFRLDRDDRPTIPYEYITVDTEDKEFHDFCHTIYKIGQKVEYENQKLKEKQYEGRSLYDRYMDP